MLLNAKATVNVWSTVVSTPLQTAYCTVLPVVNVSGDIPPVGCVTNLTRIVPSERNTIYPLMVIAPAVRLVISAAALTNVNVFEPNLALKLTAGKLSNDVVTDKSQVNAYGLSTVMVLAFTVLLNIVWSVVTVLVYVVAVEFRSIVSFDAINVVWQYPESGNNNANSILFISYKYVGVP